MKLKRPFLNVVLFAAVAIASPVRAFDQKEKENPPNRIEGLRQHPGERLQHLAKELDLTADQRQKLRPIFREQMQRLRELHDDKDLTPRERMAKLKEYREELIGQLKDILTPEQLEKFKQLRSEGPRRRKQE